MNDVPYTVCTNWKSSERKINLSTCQMEAENLDSSSEEAEKFFRISDAASLPVILDIPVADESEPIDVADQESYDSERDEQTGCRIPADDGLISDEANAIASDHNRIVRVCILDKKFGSISGVNESREISVLNSSRKVSDESVINSKRAVGDINENWHKDVPNEKTKFEFANVTNFDDGSPRNHESLPLVQTSEYNRPTLADDSRSVKIPLPANPINWVQTNAQILNKSRVFLNFLTENSKNFMEKALQPQQLTGNYNSILKTLHTVCNEKKVNADCTVTQNISLISPVLEDVDTKSCMDRDGCGNGPDLQRCNGLVQMQMYQMLTSDVNFSLAGCNQDQLNKVACTEQASAKPETKTAAEMINTNAACIYPSFTLNEVVGTQDGLIQSLLAKYYELTTANSELRDRLTYVEGQQRLEAQRYKERTMKESAAFEEMVTKLKIELRSSLESQDVLKREYELANKERENMVVKYAIGEKQLIDAQRAKDIAERRTKELAREQDVLQSKLRKAEGEHRHLSVLLDKTQEEARQLRKDLSRMRDTVKILTADKKLADNQCRNEMCKRKEVQENLDKAMIRINEMKEECEQVRRQSEESIRRFEQCEKNKVVCLNEVVKEQQARLILERHVMEDKEILRLELQKKVDSLQHSQQTLMEEKKALLLKVQKAEEDRWRYERELNNSKAIVDQRQREIVDLLDKHSDWEMLQTELHQKEEELKIAQTRAEQLRLANEELKSDMQVCRQREAEMLDFTQKLTDKNVRLQSQFTALEVKTKQLEEELGPLHELIKVLNGQIVSLEDELTRERIARTEECEILAKHLAEQTHIAQNLGKKLEDSQGENAVLRRKQQITVKELTRELQQWRKRVEAFETTSPCNSLNMTSRAESNASLTAGDALNDALPTNSSGHGENRQSGGPNRQSLIERMIRLQKDNVRKAEKIDFLGEHINDLVKELQKKKKIIQHYILHENFGALGSNDREKHKAELARHGGIMASVYNQRISDESMTLELSLEINQKLQAALEDTLLKNITLKDNIDTLGEEIAMLTMQKQQQQ